MSLVLATSGRSLADEPKEPETTGPSAPSSAPAAAPAETDSPQESKRACGEPGFVLFPIVFYSDETLLGGGLTTVLFKRNCDEDPTRAKDDSATAVLIYTMRNQFVGVLTGDAYFARAFFHLNPTLVFTRYPNNFYGFGNDTPLSVEEKYTPLHLSADVAFSVNPFEKIYLGLVTHVGYYDLLDFASDGLVADYNEKAPPQGLISGLGLRLVRDTRDDALYPTDGSWVSARAVFHHDAIGSDYDFTEVELDLRTYFPFALDSVWAFQFYGQLTTGAPPLDSVPRLGGDNLMRGYDQGRFRDNLYTVLQAEWRVPIIWRIGMTVFAAVGNVYDGLAAVRLDQIKPTGGVGLRMLLSKKRNINLRVDFGFSEEGFKFYLNILEAF